MVGNYLKNLLFGCCQKRSNVSLGRELSNEKSESRAKGSRHHNGASIKQQIGEANEASMLHRNCGFACSSASPTVDQCVVHAVGNTLMNGACVDNDNEQLKCDLKVAPHDKWQQVLQKLMSVLFFLTG